MRAAGIVTPVLRSGRAFEFAFGGLAEPFPNPCGEGNSCLIGGTLPIGLVIGLDP